MSIEFALSIAARMLKCYPDQLDAELTRRIMAVGELIGEAGRDGNLQSSQVIAVIVEQWQRDSAAGRV